MHMSNASPKTLHSLWPFSLRRRLQSFCKVCWLTFLKDWWMLAMRPCWLRSSGPAIRNYCMPQAGIRQCVNKIKKDQPTGLVKILCLSYDKKARKEHEKKKNSQTTFEGTVGISSWADTLFVWFPASWMPWVVEAIRNKTSTWLCGTISRALLPVMMTPCQTWQSATNSKDGMWTGVDRALSFMPENFDWLTLDASCVTRMFKLLYDGILRDVFNQKASMPWQPASLAELWLVYFSRVACRLMSGLSYVCGQCKWQLSWQLWQLWISFFLSVSC